MYYIILHDAVSYLIVLCVASHALLLDTDDSHGCLLEALSLCHRMIY